MEKITLSGFADEIGDDLELQLDTLEAEDIKYLEFRGVWGKSVMDLTDEELDKVKAALEDRGIGVSAIGSPIGKVAIDFDLDEHLESLERAIEIAQKMDTDCIRLFSFYLPPDEDPLKYRDEVMRRMQAFVDTAKGSGLTLLHENEADIYGMSSDLCLDMMETIDDPQLRAVFDFANFVNAGEKPYDESYPKMKPYIEYIHVKDATFEPRKIVPAGEGDGQVRPVLEDLVDSGWTGFLSLEPHLAQAGKMRGYSGPELWRKAAQALKGILDDMGVDYA
jgi:sugar phosphate isomerase/epimerase